MTEQDVETFLAVVRWGSISAAAEAMFITQPAVSRHIRELERELGCPLVRRSKGRRHIELTEQGERFIATARKWRELWRETRELAAGEQKTQLRLISVGSVSTYLLPPVFKSFLQQNDGCTICFNYQHSLEAYRCMDRGEADLALISDDMYLKGIETVPAFREPMVLLTPKQAGYAEELHPSELDPRLEIRLPWNPEYDLWHDFWFNPSIRPRATLDQMSLLEDFFSWGDSWAVMPLSAARSIARTQDVVFNRLHDGPPARIIYYLLGPASQRGIAFRFLDCLRRELENYPEIDCML